MRTHRFIIVAVSFFLLIGLVGLYLVDRNHKIRETPIARNVCVTPDPVVETVGWKLVVSNMTNFAFTSDDPGWLPTEVPMGTGELCVVVLMRPYDMIKINGLFDSDPAFWLYMRGVVNAKRVTVDGEEVAVINVSWSDGWASGSDGQFVAPFHFTLY